MWELEAHHGARIARPISDRRAAIPGAKSGAGSVQCSEAALIAVNTRRQGGSKTKHLGLEMSATITPHPVTHLGPRVRIPVLRQRLRLSSGSVKISSSADF